MQLPDGWYLYDEDDLHDPLRDIHGWLGPRTPRGTIAPFPTREAANARFNDENGWPPAVTATEATAILAMAAARLEMEDT